MTIGISTLQRVGSIVLPTIFTAVFVNFLAFLAAAYYLGGDALSGKVEQGRYYLANHGRYTEVSEQVFKYSEVHAGSVIATMPLAFLVALIFTRGQSHRSVGTFSHGGKRNSNDA